MKKIILFLTLTMSFFYLETNAQWDTLANAGFTNSTATTINLAGHNNNIYCAYRNGQNSNRLSVQKYNAGSWTHVGPTVITSTAVIYVDIEVDTSGNPWVAYTMSNGSVEVLTVMKFNGTTWDTIGTPNISGGVAQEIDLAFNASNQAHVSYTDGTNFPVVQIQVKKFDGNAWVSLGVVETGVVPNNPANFSRIAFQPSTQEPFVFYEYSGGKVRYHNGTSWVDVGGTQSFTASVDFTNIAFNPTGEPYVAFRDKTSSNFELGVMKFDGTSWGDVGQSGSISNNPSFISLGFHNSTPYVSFKDDNAPFAAAVKYFNGSNWVYLGGSGNINGGPNTQEIDMIIQDGVVYVGFQDPDQSNKATVMKYDIALALDELEQINSSINIYPNPSINIITVDSDYTINQLLVRTLDGKLLKTVNTTNQITVAELPQGIYLLEVLTEKGRGHKVFVKK